MSKQLHFLSSLCYKTSSCNIYSPQFILLTLCSLGIWTVSETVSYAHTPDAPIRDALNSHALNNDRLAAHSVAPPVRFAQESASAPVLLTTLNPSTVTTIDRSAPPVKRHFVKPEKEVNPNDILLEHYRSGSSQPSRITDFLRQNPQKYSRVEILLLPIDSTQERIQSNSTHLNQDQQEVAAGPENFNPELSKPSPPPSLNPPDPSSSPLIPTPKAPEPPVFDLEPAPFVSFDNLQVDFRRSRDNFGQVNQFFEPTLQFRFGEEPALFQIKTGFNIFEQRKIETVTNIPIQLGWQTQIGQNKLQIAAGIDIFNRLPTAFNLSAQATIPVAKQVTLFTVVEQGPYKANAETLGNQITAWRFGPNIYWQIDRSTSFFSSFRLGLFNDGNRELQSFSRLERRLGQFYVAANVFTWNFSEDVQEKSGYFSPPDFLVYNGEVGWEGDVLNFLRCRVSTNLGQQRLNGRITAGNTYQARCTVKLSREVDLDVGYTFTNVANRDTGSSVYSNQSFLGQLRVNF